MVTEKLELGDSHREIKNDSMMSMSSGKRLTDDEREISKSGVNTDVVLIMDSNRRYILEERFWKNQPFMS